MFLIKLEDYKFRICWRKFRYDLLDEVIILQNKDKIICESLITLSNNDQSWYDMMIYKENGTIFYKVEPNF